MNKWLMQIANDPLCSIYLGLQIIIFILCFLKIMFPIYKRRRQIKKFQAIIKTNTTNQNNDSAIRSYIQSEFKNQLSWGYEPFKQYNESWMCSRIGEENKASLPIRIKEFLTPEIVLDQIRNQRIADALPGFFVSIGIFGTFLGLVLGLSDINLAQVENMAKGVETLISGLALAFSSSLLGILCSIVFSISYKYLITNLENSFLSFDDFISGFYPYHSNESYAGRHLAVQLDVKHSLQTLATDIATKLGPTIGKAIESELGPLMAEFTDLLKKYLADMGETTQKSTEGLVNLFDEKFRGLFEDLTLILKETTDVQSGMKAQMENFADNLQKHFKGQEDLIEKTSRAGQILGESLASLENISMELKSSADHVATAATLLEGSAEKAKEGHEVLKDTMEKQIFALTKTREELAATWIDITDNTGAVVELIRSTIGELEEGVGNNLIKALESFDGKVAEVVERFSGTLFETSEVIGELPMLIGKLDETFKLIGSDIIAQKDLIQNLNNTTKDIVAPNIEKAVTAAVGLNDTGETLMQIKNEIQTLFSQILSDLGKNFNLIGHEGPINNQLIALNEKLNESKHPSGNGNSDLAKYLKTLNANLEDIKGIIQTDNNGINNNIITKLVNSIDSMNTKVEFISKNFNGDSFQTLNKINAATVHIAKLMDGFKKGITNDEQQNNNEKKGFFGRMRTK